MKKIVRVSYENGRREISYTARVEDTAPQTTLETAPSVETKPAKIEKIASRRTCDGRSARELLASLAPRLPRTDERKSRANIAYARVGRNRFIARAAA